MVLDCLGSLGIRICRLSVLFRLFGFREFMVPLDGDISSGSSSCFMLEAY